jgi:hypothetical protein
MNQISNNRKLHFILSTILMNLHKILQPIVDFKNMQVPIAPIVKDKLLALHTWLSMFD